MMRSAQSCMTTSAAQRIFNSEDVSDNRRYVCCNMDRTVSLFTILQAQLISITSLFKLIQVLNEHGKNFNIRQRFEQLYSQLFKFVNNCVAV